MTNLTISTHPGMTLDNHFRLDIPPSPTLSQQSITIAIPAAYYCVHVIPTLSASLLHRQYKLLVTLNRTPVNPIPVKPEETNPRRPIYEVRVVPGISRIEVDLIAGSQRGAPKVGPGQDIELERITIFANILP